MFKNFNNVGYIKRKLSKKTMKVLEEAIKNKKENWNHNLAGQIDSSFIIEDKNNWFFKNELLSCIDEYLENTANQKWIIPELLNKNCAFKLSTFWVNFQKKYEFNPFHTHTALFSFVVWVKIPARHDKEKNLPFVNHSNCSYPNTFQMFYINSLGKIATEDYYLNPEDEGTMLFFTGDRPHLVYPFYSSDKTRVSISGNIILNVDEVLQ
jgi:hypothetical protein|tara:strand:+ start:180 stop:806 length:627 start_codon:yes stop_codon:yes gene_type:complete